MRRHTEQDNARVIYDRVSGASRGFAFVSFENVGGVEAATACMQNLQGKLSLPQHKNGRLVDVRYSRYDRDEAHSGGGTVFGDWICPKCNTNNFARRQACFSCQAPRGPDALPASRSAHSNVSVSSGGLVVRDLDPTTTEATLHPVMAAYGALQRLEIIRDTVTLQSKCFAFVDYVVQTDAARCLQNVNESGGLWVDGKQVAVSFAKDTKAMAPTPKRANSGMSSVAAQALAAASWGMASGPGPAPAAPQQAAPQAPGQHGSTFVLDSSTGLYYDQSSGYFYDPKTQVYLYYNQQLQCYMKYDEVSKSYVKYDPDKSAGESKQGPTKPKKAKKSKKKSVEQDMEKWFKREQERRAAVATTDTQTAVAPAQPTGNDSAGGWTSEAKTAPIEVTGGWTETAVSNATEALAAERAAERARAEAKSSLETEAEEFAASVGATGAASAGPSEAMPDLLALGTNFDTCKQLTYVGKPIVMTAKGKWACLVSRRQFGTEEAIRSHIQLSDLYKDSLQKAINEGKVKLVQS